MKVVHLINNLRSTGPVYVLRDLVYSLSLCQVESIIICLHQRKEYPTDHIQSDRDRVAIYYLGNSFATLEFRPSSVAKQVEHICRKMNANIIHTHGYHPDLLHPYLPKDYVKLSTQHNISKEDFCFGKGKLIGSYMHLRLWQCLRDANAIVGISDFVRAYCSERASKHTQVVGILNGINWEQFTPKQSKVEARKTLGLSETAPILVSVGSLSRRKDPFTIIRAFKKLVDKGSLPQDATLIFLGQGSLLRKCKKESEGYERQIHFLGFSNHISTYLQGADLLITASHSEGFGLNVAEALASHLVVICTKLPAFADMLQSLPQIQKLQFAPKDTDSLSNAILSGLQTNISNEQYSELQKLLDRKRMGREYATLYEHLTKTIL